MNHADAEYWAKVAERAELKSRQTLPITFVRGKPDHQVRRLTADSRRRRGLVTMARSERR